jgi:hypothetical protein
MLLANLRSAHVDFCPTSVSSKKHEKKALDILPIYANSTCCHSAILPFCLLPEPKIILPPTLRAGIGVVIGIVIETSLRFRSSLSVRHVAVPK